MRASTSTIVIDGGDLFFSKPVLTPQVLAVEQVRARALVQAYNLLSTDVMTVGERDLAGGVDFLLELADAASFTIISANLTDTDGNHPLPPSIIIERVNLNWGFIGVSAQQGEVGSFSFNDPVKAVQKQVRTMRSQVDFLTVLYHGGRDQLELLTQSVNDVDLIIHSHVNALRGDLGVGPIPVAQLGAEGKYACEIRVDLDVPGGVIKDISRLKKTLTYAKRGLERLRRNQPDDAQLEDIYADNPKILGRIAIFKKRISSVSNELEGVINSIDFIPIALGADIADDKQMLEFVDHTKSAMGAVGDTTSIEIAQLTN